MNAKELPADLLEALRIGLKLPQYAILKYMVVANRPVTVQDAVDATGMSDPAMRRVLHTLYDRGFILRSHKPPIGGHADRATTYTIRK